MTDRRDALLQARLDGELTAAERVELEHLLAGDAAARARAGELEALVDALNLLGPVDPPARVMHTVIDHINDTRPAAMDPSPVASSSGGVGMRTKVLWGLAAAAAIVLAVFAYTGFPPDPAGSEGAIGAAKRYQAGQIAASDVKLGDQAAQDFLQSDLFDKLMKDESVRKALSDPALGKALSDPALGKALTDEAFGRALRDPAFGRALTDADLTKALTDVDLRFRLTDAALVKALGDPALVKALSDPALGKALADPALGRALADPALGRALASADLRMALNSNGLAAALKSPQFGEALRRGIRY